MVNTFTKGNKMIKRFFVSFFITLFVSGAFAAGTTVDNMVASKSYVDVQDAKRVAIAQGANAKNAVLETGATGMVVIKQLSPNQNVITDSTGRLKSVQKLTGTLVTGTAGSNSNAGNTLVINADDSISYAAPVSVVEDDLSETASAISNVTNQQYFTNTEDGRVLTHATNSNGKIVVTADYVKLPIGSPTNAANIAQVWIE